MERGNIVSGFIWLGRLTAGQPAHPFPARRKLGISLASPSYFWKADAWQTQALKRYFSLFTSGMSRCQMTRHQRPELHRQFKGNAVPHLEPSQHAAREPQPSSLKRSERRLETTKSRLRHPARCRRTPWPHGARSGLAFPSRIDNDLAVVLTFLTSFTLKTGLSNVQIKFKAGRDSRSE